MKLPPILIELPAWAASLVEPGRVYATDDEKMVFVDRLARENVDRETGGPFGAAVFELGSGRLVAAGVNSVIRLNNFALHAELTALQFAARAVGSYALSSHELVSSCDPCAMCLGAILWSGVRRVVCGATREDALRIGFDEGPVFPESWQYLADRGVEIVHGVRRAEAAATIERYRGRGPIYNG